MPTQSQALRLMLEAISAMRAAGYLPVQPFLWVVGPQLLPVGHWEGREGQDVRRGVRQQLGHLGKGLPKLFHHPVQLAVDLHAGRRPGAGHRGFPAPRGRTSPALRLRPLHELSQVDHRLVGLPVVCPRTRAMPEVRQALVKPTLFSLQRSVRSSSPITFRCSHPQTPLHAGLSKPYTDPSRRRLRTIATAGICTSSGYPPFPTDQRRPSFLRSFRTSNHISLCRSTGTVSSPATRAIVLPVVNPVDMKA